MISIQSLYPFSDAILPRASAELAPQVSYGFDASVLEIYNEQLYDLLSGNKDSGTC